MESLKGIIFETIFRNNDNGYTVALMETDNEVITITGTFVSDIMNENLEVFGKRVTHPRYGEQFAVDMYNSVLPTEANEIESYLSSGLIKGIGKYTAKKIVEAFGEDTFDILQMHPERLTEIEGVGEKKAVMISESFSQQIDVREIMMFLQSKGISTNFGVKIYKQYGKNTINVISENPYKLTEDIYGIGFRMADKIASSLGVEKESPFRIAAGIKYALTEYAARGHSYVPLDMLTTSVGQLLESDGCNIDDELKNMAFQGKVHIENINDVQVVYYMPYHNAEVNVCKNLINLACTDFDMKADEVESFLFQAEAESSIELTDMQREAVIQSVQNGVTVITGGPGTGKTTIIRTIIHIFELMGKKIMLCAPTGRAAKRITESTGREAKTIHRMLEYAYGEDDSDLAFNKNEDSPLDCQVVIVDEVSMVDIILMNNLLKAMKTGTRLILVGDADQLPSVGAGNVLKDIIDSETVCTIKLDKIFRQSLGSMIVQNAHAINKGEMPVLNGKNSDFFFMQRAGADIADLIVELYKTRLPAKYGYDPLKDIQVLSPMKKGDIGVIELNNRLQAAVNPPDKLKKEKAMGKYLFRMGDKVMQVKNNYQLSWNSTDDDGKAVTGEGVYNGDIGYITFIDNVNQQLFVRFDDSREIAYPYAQLDELILAYASTVHKSQGSEFPAVIMPVAWGPPMLLTRNLFYTAITRARGLVVLVGMEKYIRFMIDNVKTDERFSALDYRLSSVASFIGIQEDQ